MDSNWKWLVEMAEQKNQELESVLGYATDGVGKFACDPKLTILYYNAGLAELVGTTRGKIEREGFNSSLYIHPDDVTQVRERLGTVLRQGKPFELRYRLRHTSGNFLWVKVKGIFTEERYQDVYPVVYLVFTDITNLVDTNEKLARAYEQLEVENKRYKAVTELVSEVFFEYNAETRSVSFWGGNLDDADIAPPTQENITLFLAAFGRNIGMVDMEVQLYDRRHTLSWYSIKARGIQTFGGDEWARIIGTTRSIQKQKEEATKRSEQEKELLAQARYDSMTRLLNRSALQQAVEEQIRIRDRYLCAVLDIDDFKVINDTYGHVFGDEVLRHVAGTLQGICRPQDFAGRLGGDEFMMLFCSIRTEEQARDRLERILKAIRESGDSLSIRTNISVSIGAIFVTKPGLSFLDVYRRADSALYAAKHKGKNTCSIAIHA